jgi:hypothetical protein
MSLRNSRYFLKVLFVRIHLSFWLDSLGIFKGMEVLKV